VVRRERRYSDGAAITYYSAPEGKGFCPVVDGTTTADFGCIRFCDAPEFDHVEAESIDGVPWERWVMIACPNCNGVGSANDRACKRCSGTAKVRRYDDGYVADETWDHPLEKERKKTAGQKPYEEPTLKPIPQAERPHAIAQTPGASP
jgi:hypothetical protein